MCSSISGCIGLRYSSMSRGNPSSGRVNQSQGGSWKVLGSWCGREWGVSPSFCWGVSLSRAVSMFIRHRFMESRDSATSSARFSHSSSSGRADIKIKPYWLSRSLNCDDFFLFPTFVQVRHWVREGGTVLWSRVCCKSGIVCLSPSQMLCTTIPFLEFNGSATYLPVVLTGLGW